VTTALSGPSHVAREQASATAIEIEHAKAKAKNFGTNLGMVRAPREDRETF